MEAFNASISFDKRLYPYDIQGSLAHAKMLKKIGILKATDFNKISKGLEKVKKELDNGKFKFSNSFEDIHMAIEHRLIKLIGPLGGKLHTARSRNDQVALDLRLFTIDQTKKIQKEIQKLQKNLVSLAEKNTTTILPGYTHLQRAQPVLLSHHLLAYFEMLRRDFQRLEDNLVRLNECPLGAGALAGTPIKIDRLYTARTLGFSEVSRNSLDAVSDRDFVLDFLFAAATLSTHLSRFCEELILWSSQEFGFVTLPTAFCTGSSMMPQKVNPDALELIRGKTGRVYGNLLSLFSTLKSLPLAYNKDMQEDKEPLFDSADTITKCLEILNALTPKCKFHPKKMLEATTKGFLLATDAADYLVKKGLPFRQAHKVVGKLIQFAISKNCGLEDLDLKTLKKYSKLFSADIKKTLSIQNSVNSRTSLGGTATNCVKREISRANKILKKK